MADPRSEQTIAPGRGGITQHCARCDGQTLWFDAHAAWNVDTATWEVASVYDEATCLDCGRAGVDVVARRDGAARGDARVRPAPVDPPIDPVGTMEVVPAGAMAHAGPARQERSRACREGGA